jgi:hypothetical protein
MGGRGWRWETRTNKQTFKVWQPRRAARFEQTDLAETRKDTIPCQILGARIWLLCYGIT